MDRDPRLLDLKLAAMYPNNYSYPVRQQVTTSNTTQQRYHRESVSSEASNPGLIPDHSSDSDTEIDVEDFTYHENANQLWDTFWTPKNSQGQVRREKYPALMASPATHMVQRRGPTGAASYQRGNLHIVSSSVDSIDESPAGHGAIPEPITAPEWPLPPRGLSPSQEKHSSHVRQHSRPHKVQCSVPIRPSLTPNSSSLSLAPLGLPPRTSSLSRCGTPLPPSPPMKATTHLSRPAGLSLFPGHSGMTSHSAPVTPAVHTPIGEIRPTTSGFASHTMSRSSSRTRASTHQPQVSIEPQTLSQPRDSTGPRRPNSHSLSKSVSTPDLKKQVRPRTVPIRENGTRAPYYQEVSFLSSFPLSPQPSITPTIPSLTCRSTTNLSVIASYMDEDAPPVPSLTSSFSSQASTQNVSVWEDDSDDENDAPRPSGLSRILNPNAHKRASSKDQHKRASSRDGRESALSNGLGEPKATVSRKRSDTVFGRMLGRRSR